MCRKCPHHNVFAHTVPLVVQVLEVGDKVEVQVAKGDTIVFTKYGTTDVEVADGKVTFLRGDSLLGVCA